MSTPVWFLFPPADEAAFRGIYNGYAIRGIDNPTANEQVGTAHVNAAGTLAFVGTTRVSPERRPDVEIGKPAWLQIVDEFPPDWEWPEVTP